MKDLLLWVIVLIASAGLLTLAFAKAGDAQTRRLNARAHLIEVKSDARQDALAGLMPFVVIVAIATGGSIGIVALMSASVAIVAIVTNRSRHPRMIERQVVIVLQPGQTKPSAYRFLSSAARRIDVQQEEAQETVVYRQEEIR